jgi:hypothetical protein
MKMPGDKYGLWVVFTSDNVITAVVEGTAHQVEDKFANTDYWWEFLPEVEVIGDEPEPQTFRAYVHSGGEFEWDDVILAANSEGIPIGDYFAPGDILWSSASKYAYDPQCQRIPANWLIRKPGGGWSQYKP